MNDNDIIKALECCSTTQLSCHVCKYQTSKRTRKQTIGCSCELMGDALSLVNRQKAEIERLEELLKGWKTEAYKVADEKDELYCNAVERVKAAKAEAIKEFAEEIENALKNNYEVRGKRMRSIHRANDDFLSYLEGKIDCLIGLQSFLKEMVGERE